MSVKSLAIKDEMITVQNSFAFHFIKRGGKKGAAFNRWDVGNIKPEPKAVTLRLAPLEFERGTREKPGGRFFILSPP